MSERRLDVVGSAAPPMERAGPAMGRGASIVATAMAVHLLLAIAVLEDRRSTEPSTPVPRARAASPTPAPSRSPDVITAEEEAVRRRIALNTARFTAGQVCADSRSFLYDVIETSSDVVESVISAHDPSDASGILVKVTLLQGGYGVSYRVLEERGDCDA